MLRKAPKKNDTNAKLSSSSYLNIVLKVFAVCGAVLAYYLMTKTNGHDLTYLPDFSINGDNVPHWKERACKVLDAEKIQCESKIGNIPGKICSYSDNEKIKTVILKELARNTEEELQILFNKKSKSNLFRNEYAAALIKLINPQVFVPDHSLYCETSEKKSFYRLFSGSDFDKTFRPFMTDYNNFLKVENAKLRRSIVNEAAGGANNIATLIAIQAFIPDIINNPGNWGRNSENQLTIVDTDFPVLNIASVLETLYYGLEVWYQEFKIALTPNDVLRASKIFENLLQQTSPPGDEYVRYDDMAFRTVVETYDKVFKEVIKKIGSHRVKHQGDEIDDRIIPTILNALAPHISLPKNSRFVSKTRI